MCTRIVTRISKAFTQNWQTILDIWQNISTQSIKDFIIWHDSNPFISSLNNIWQRQKLLLYSDNYKVFEYFKGSFLMGKRQCQILKSFANSRQSQIVFFPILIFRCIRGKKNLVSIFFVFLCVLQNF